MDLQGQTVVVVDDDKGSLILLCHTLRSVFKCEVRVASGGKEAKEIMKRDDISVVFTDLSMPDMDGWKLLEVIRSDQRTSSIVVIAVTAHVMAGDKERVLAGGFDGFLGKPYYPTQLGQVLGDILAEVPQQRANRKEREDRG